MIWSYVLKVLVSAVVVVAVSELGKRSSFWGAALASLPLTSLLAFVWMRLDGTETQRIAGLSVGIFWLVLPSLLLFLVFPALLRAGMGFWLSLLLSCIVTAGAYALMVLVLERLGVRP
jgi:predicted permease